ncbi:CAP domain-containing protein [Bacillus seohaeanensis]|jgi:uncharacterized YkwD family protein|uniref:CAP domain-containing protein n=1 Tax=Bacillus seohaeanensis TaxID=284580 RepID=A0ABW5RSG0_9BACI
MNKKMIISTATALTLLAAPFAAGKADAAEQTQVKTYKQVYTYNYNGNQEDLNKWVQNILSKYQIQWKDMNKAPAKAEAPAPVKEQPKAETPAPAEKEAPKAEAPKQEAAPTPVKEQQAKQEQPAKQTNSQLSQFEQQVVELTNQERAKQGLPALKIDAELSKVAREKSRDMSANNYFSHTSPTYGSPFDMMKQFGIQYKSAGENIAMGQRTPQEVVNAWMNSDGHRKNIMSSKFTHIGVGHVENGNYWTQQFIGK